MSTCIVCCWVFDIDLKEKRKRKLQKKEPNETRNNEETMEKKVQQICRKRTEHTFWNMLIYTYLYACVSHTIAMKRMTKNEKFILLLLGVCVILFWFFFLLVVEPSSHHHLRRIAHQVTQEMSKVTLAHINFSGLSVQKYRFWY